ncbi:MAG: DUF1598 domain-containing protein [Pirellulales bacterium]
MLKKNQFVGRAAVCLLLFSLLAAVIAPSFAGGIFNRGGAVGGIFIDAEGVVSTPEVGSREQLLAKWESGLEPVPADLEKFTDLRMVSLRRLDSEIARCRKEQKPLPDAVRYLAGLQRVEYVLVYPEQGDIVLAGPAEGWKVDSLGNTVGATTNRPVLLLEDLIVALRTAEASNGDGISCSIDPTDEGVARWRQLEGRLGGESPTVAARRIEQALGEQVITVSGVPTTSHFARTLVAADFRMKRLAMNFEPAPVDGLPSYLSLMKTGRGAQNALPRWWLAADYQPLLRDAAGLAWQIRGQGVKCMTEDDFVAEDGSRQRSGKSSSAAQRWADMFTEKYEDLANHDSSFGHLRNAVDLAVVGALLHKERLVEKTKLELPWLMEQEQIEEYPAPQRVASQASLLKKGRNWIISASGGVQFQPWMVADSTEESAEIAPIRDKVAAAEANTSWWW